MGRERVVPRQAKEAALFRWRQLLPRPRVTGLVLWSVVVIFALLDVALTQYGVGQGLVELNPLASTLIIELGALSLVGAKGTAVFVGAIMWKLLSTHRNLIPLTYVFIWGSAVLANMGLIYLHL